MPGRITQTRARHVLLRTSPQLSALRWPRAGWASTAQQIESGARSFEDIARQFTAKTARPSAGGDLGWAGPWRDGARVRAPR